MRGVAPACPRSACSAIGCGVSAILASTSRPPSMRLRTGFAARGIPAQFIQVSLMEVPLPDASVDVLYSQGVLHHTDSTEQAIRALATKLKVGGRFLFYVYRRKGPIREFTDDYIRTKLQDLTPEQAWEAMMPITKLGKELGDRKIEVEIPEAIELLDLPAGKFDLQRLIYQHMFQGISPSRYEPGRAESYQSRLVRPDKCTSAVAGRGA